MCNNRDMTEKEFLKMVAQIALYTANSMRKLQFNILNDCCLFHSHNYLVNGAIMATFPCMV